MRSDFYYHNSSCCTCKPQVVHFPDRNICVWGLEDVNCTAFSTLVLDRSSINNFLDIILSISMLAPTFQLLEQLFRFPISLVLYSPINGSL